MRRRIALVSLGSLLSIALVLASWPTAPRAAEGDVAEVVLFVGMLSAQNAVDRRQGILDELAGVPLPQPKASTAPLTLPPIILKAGEKPRVAFVTNNS